MVHRLAYGLGKAGHEIHVVTPDLDIEEQRAEKVWYWPPQAHPTQADTVVMVHSLEFVDAYSADYLIMATNGIDPMLGPDHSYASGVDAFPIFSEKHGELMRQFRPTIKPEQCFVTGLGIDLSRYLADPVKVPGRLLFANDPARGLWHVLDIFDHLHRYDDKYTLHVAYDFDRQFEHHRWSATTIAEALWDCKKRLESTPGVTNVGGLGAIQLIEEQHECQIHVMPSDPPNAGSQIHGITQMECAAAGAALVLSDIEAFPEVFGQAATILPVVGTWLPKTERRYDAQDWAEAVHALAEDSDRLSVASAKARKLAEINTWDHVIERWQGMLTALSTAPVAV
jgi:glycosyltransferase involved in cell wall biosynthesis